MTGSTDLQPLDVQPCAHQDEHFTGSCPPHTLIIGRDFSVRGTFRPLVTTLPQVSHVGRNVINDNERKMRFSSVRSIFTSPQIALAPDKAIRDHNVYRQSRYANLTNIAAWHNL